MTTADWLIGNRALILLEYSRCVESGEFPSYEVLGPLARRRVFEREIDGLIAYAGNDPEELARIESVHAQQAHDLTSGLPVDEQIRFLDAKIATIRAIAAADAVAESILEPLDRLLGFGREYYVARLLKLEESGPQAQGPVDDDAVESR